MHLSASEDGMYGRMLDLFYSSERPLPADRKKLYTMLRANTKEDQKAVEAIAQQFFSKCSAGLMNNRARREVEKARKISISRSNAGKQRGKRPTNAEQMLSKQPTQPEARTQTTPVPSVYGGSDPSAVALTKKFNPPVVPPQPGGRTNGANGSTETIFQWSREYVAVKMGNRRRLFTNRDQEILAGARADRVVDFLHSRGFEARVVPEEEINAKHN